MGFCCFGSDSVKEDVVSPPPAPVDKTGAATPEAIKEHTAAPATPAQYPNEEAASVHSEQGPPLPPWNHNAQTSNSQEFAGSSVASFSGSRNVAQNTITEALRLNLGEIKFVLQKIASVNTTPTIGLSEAAELLCKHLSVSLVSITGITEGLSSYILLAAHGVGAAELERYVVMKGPGWTPYQVVEQQGLVRWSAKSADDTAHLPTDLAALCRSAGLRSFLAVPVGIGPNDTAGVLTIAKEEPHGFDDEWWEPMLGVIAVGLLPSLKNEHINYLCHLIRVLDHAQDTLGLIALLLQGAHRLLLKTTNIKMGCRLGLLSTDATKAIVFECDILKIKDEIPANRNAPGATPNGGPAPLDIHITEISLENTLLLDAVTKGKARFVSDCASYLQSCMKPASDIFISTMQMVASIVVLPLIYNGTTLGGLYFTLEVTSNFQNIKDLLMGFVNGVVLVLYQKLHGRIDQVWEIVQGRTSGVASLSTEGSTGQPSNDGDSGDGTNVNKKVYVKRGCTEAMLKVLQNEIRKTHAKSQAVQWMDELMLTETIGKGGFGVVYKGTWKGSVAAIKVMYARQHERQAMKDALEMAVLTTVSHPNIIQVYSCFTDMVEDAGSTNSSTGGTTNYLEGRINVRFRKLQPDEDKSLATCNIVVMEYCDRGSLRHAMKRGVFHKRLGNTSVAVDLCAIVQVLIEVAQAIQHLHSMKLIHCDIKPENVLLKTDATKPVGFITKLSDFGLAKLLRENYYIVNRSGSGTVTHLAPELFQVGSKVTTAVDTFSFGIMMWELYTGQRAYSGLGRDAIIDRVYKKQARPVFPSGVPPAYASLAKACWENDQGLRPPFVLILNKLNEMLHSFQIGSYAGPGGQAIGEGALGQGANYGSSTPSAQGGLGGGRPLPKAMPAA